MVVINRQPHLKFVSLIEVQLLLNAEIRNRKYTMAKFSYLKLYILSELVHYAEFVHGTLEYIFNIDSEANFSIHFSSSPPPDRFTSDRNSKGDLLLVFAA